MEESPISPPDRPGTRAVASIRVEDARLLTGRGTFVDDVHRPGMLDACFVRSPACPRRIQEIDVSEALAVPGVRAALTAAEPQPRRARVLVHRSGVPT